VYLLNKAILIGNLTRDPELRTTQSGISVCTFTVAVQRRSNQTEKQADFIPVVTWRALAENCGKYLAKGRMVAVLGSIQTRTYDAQNGEKRYVTEVLADEVQFLSKAGGGTGGERSAPAERSSDNLFGDELNDFTPLDEEDLPF
jgi:single-strand DNA-binding protein